MKRIKRFLQKILIYILKKLNMPRPFSDLSKKDMINIYRSMHDFCDHDDVIPLYNMPELLSSYLSLAPSKTRSACVLEITRLSDNAKVSINILPSQVNHCDVIVDGVDSNTENLIIKITKSYLRKNRFI